MGRKKRLDPIDQLDKLLDFYSRQQDFVGGRVIPVWMSVAMLQKFAGRIGEDLWSYRGFTLQRRDPE